MRKIYCTRCIEHSLNPETKRWTPDQIVDLSCEFLMVDRKKLVSRSREQRLVEARNMIASLLYSDSYLRMTLLEIAQLLGKRDHSTIIHGNKQLDTLMQVYPDVKEMYKNLHLHVYHTLMHYPYDL